MFIVVWKCSCMLKWWWSLPRGNVVPRFDLSLSISPASQPPVVCVFAPLSQRCRFISEDSNVFWIRTSHRILK